MVERKMSCTALVSVLIVTGYLVQINAGDVCSVLSADKTRSEVVTTTDNSAQLFCGRRIYDQYTIRWIRYSHNSQEYILDHYSTSNSVHYHIGISESDYTLNTTDSSLTVHNVTLMDAGCYRCGQQHINKYVLDAVHLTTVSSSSLSCTMVHNRYLTERTVSEGEQVRLPCPFSIEEQYQQDVSHIGVQWYYGSTGQPRILYHDFGSPSFSWRSNYSHSDFTYNTTDLSLTIPHMTSWYNGCYRCLQTTSFRYLYDTVTLTVTDVASATSLTMSGAPAAGELIDEGTSMTVECATDEGNPTPQVTWTRNGSNLDHETESVQNIEMEGDYNVNKTTSILTIQVTRSHNNNQYSCITGLLSEMFTLLVKFPETLLTISGAPTVGELIDEGSSITVECVTDEGNPTPQVTWTREGSNLDSVTDSVENLEVAGRYNSQKMTSRLTIEVTRNHNNMQFSCITGSISRTFTLPVRFPAISLTMFGAPEVGDWTEEGKTVSVECVTDEGNPITQVTWTREGSNLNSETDSIDNLEVAGRYSSQKMTSTLIIKVTQSHNNMQYSCITGSMSQTFTLSVRFAATSLTMSGEPEVGEWVEEGTTVVVECVTDEGNPTPQVTWTRDEGNLNPLTESVQNFEVAGRYNSNIRRSVLAIQVHKSQHNNRFTCTSGSTGSQFFTLAVRYGAHIILLSSSPESTNPVEEYSVINFTCTIDVNPPPYLTLWTRGKVDQIHEQSETSSLMVSLNITRKYNKVGIFCEAVRGELENATTSNELYFDVMFGATQLNLTSSHIALIDEGQQLNLTSLTDEGNPTPDITWTRNGESIQTTQNLVVIYDGQFNAKYMMSTLTLTAYRGLDNSQYMCRVGSLYSVYQLQVTWPTEPAHSVMIEERTSHTAKVSWISGHNGGSPQIFIVQFKTVDEITFNSSPFMEDTGFGSKLNYNINNLQANTVYSIKIIAMNSYQMQQHRVESIVTFKTLPEASSSSNIALIAGTVPAGVVVLFVISVVGTILLCKCRNRSKQAHTANPVTENDHNAQFSDNHISSVESAQYEEITLPLKVTQLRTANVTQGEKTTRPESEQYEKVTGYELPSQYITSQRQREMQPLPSYASVDDTPDYVNA